MPALPAHAAENWDTALNEYLNVSLDTDGTLKAGAVDNAAALASNVVTTAKILDENVTAAKIANRTREFLVPISSIYSSTDAVWTGGQSVGWILEDAKTMSLHGAFFVPSDFVSGMTIKLVATATGAGDCYATNVAYQGAVGAAYNTHTTQVASSAVTMAANVISEVYSITMSSVAADDYVTLYFVRYGAHSSDTINADVYALGWQVTYTADS